MIDVGFSEIVVIGVVALIGVAVFRIGQRTIKTIMSAFPDGVEPHRQAHLAMIAAAEAEEKFWTDLKFELRRKSLLWLLMIVISLAAAGIGIKTGVLDVFHK